MGLLNGQWNHEREKNMHRKLKKKTVENHFKHEQFCLWNFKNPCVTSRFHQLQVHQQANTVFLFMVLCRETHWRGSLTKNKKIKKIGAALKCGPGQWSGNFSPSQGRNSDINHCRENSHCQRKPTTTHNADTQWICRGIKELSVQLPQQQQKPPVWKLRATDCGTINRENVRICLSMEPVNQYTRECTPSGRWHW